MMKISKKQNFKLVTWSTLFFVLFQAGFDPSLAHAFSIKTSAIDSSFTSSLQLPSKLGTLEKIYWNHQSQKPVVFHLVDAHTSLNAQKQIVSILQHLKQHAKLEALGLEGASGILEPQRLNQEADAKKQTYLWNQLMRSGDISGGTRFLLNHQEMPAFGLEDIATYRENYEIAREVLSKESMMKRFSDALQVQLDQKAAKHFSSTVRQFLNQWKQRFSAEPQWDLYFTQLFQMSAKELGMDWANPFLQKEWPMLVRMQKLLRLQEKQNTPQALQQLSTLQKVFFADQATLSELQTLHEWVVLSQKGAEQIAVQDLSFREVTERLTDRLWQRGMTFYRFPELRTWLAYQTLAQEIKAEWLDQEMQLLENKIWNQLASNASSQSLVQLYHFLFLLKAATRLEMTPTQVQEWEKLIQAGILDQVETALGNREINNRQIWKQTLQKIQQFYVLVLERDQIFSLEIIENLKKLSPKSSLFGLAVITGGFHQKGFEQSIRQAGFSYVLIHPKFNLQGETIPYLEKLLGNSTSESTLQLPQTRVMSPASAALMPGQISRNESVDLIPTAASVNVFETLAEARSEVRGMSLRRFLGIAVASMVAVPATVEAGLWDRLNPLNWKISFDKKEPATAPTPAPYVSPFEGKDKIELRVEDIDALILESDIRLVAQELEYFVSQESKKQGLGWSVSADLTPGFEDGKFKLLTGANLHSAYGNVSVFGINAGADWTSAVKASFDVARAFLGGRKNDKALLEEAARLRYLQLQNTFLERRQLAINLLMRIQSNQENLSYLDAHIAFLDRSVKATEGRRGADSEADLKLTSLRNQMLEARRWRADMAQKLDEDSRDLILMVSRSEADITKPVLPKFQFSESADVTKETFPKQVELALGDGTYTEQILADGTVELPRNRDMALQLSATRLAWLAQKQVKLSRISLNGLLSRFFDSFGKPDEDARVRQRLGQSSLIPQIRDRGYAEGYIGAQASMILGGTAWKSRLAQAAATYQFEQIRSASVRQSVASHIHLLRNSNTRWRQEVKAQAQALSDHEKIMLENGVKLTATGVTLENHILPLHDLAPMSHAALRLRMEHVNARYLAALSELSLYTVGAFSHFHIQEPHQIQGTETARSSSKVTSTNLPSSRATNAPVTRPRSTSPRGGARSEIRSFRRAMQGALAGTLLVGALGDTATLKATAAERRLGTTSTEAFTQSQFPDLAAKAQQTGTILTEAIRTWTAVQQRQVQNPDSFSPMEMAIQQGDFERASNDSLLAQLDLQYAGEQGEDFVKSGRHHQDQIYAQKIRDRVTELRSLNERLKGLPKQTAVWDKLSPARQNAVTGFLNSYALLQERLTQTPLVSSGPTSVPGSASASVTSSGNSDVDYIISMANPFQRMQGLKNFWEKNARPATDIFKHLIERGTPEVAHEALKRLVSEKSYSQLFELYAGWKASNKTSLVILAEEAIQDSLSTFPDLSALASLAERNTQVESHIETFIVGRLTKNPRDVWAKSLLRQTSLFEETDLAGLVEKYPSQGRIFYDELVRRVTIRLTQNNQLDAVGQRTTQEGVLFKDGAARGAWIEHNRRTDLRTLLVHEGDGNVLRTVDAKVAGEALDTVNAMLKGNIPAPLDEPSMRIPSGFSNPFDAAYVSYWNALGVNQRINEVEAYASSGQWREVIRILDIELDRGGQGKSVTQVPVAAKILNLISHNAQGRLWVADYVARDSTHQRTILSFKNGQGSLLELLQVDMAQWGQGQAAENQWNAGFAAGTVQTIYGSFLEASIRFAENDDERFMALRYWLAIQPSEYDLVSLKNDHPFQNQISPEIVALAFDQEIQRRATLVATDILLLRRSSSGGLYKNDLKQDVYQYVRTSLGMKYAPNFRGMLAETSRQQGLERQFPGKSGAIEDALDDLDEVVNHRLSVVQAHERESLNAWHFFQSVFQSISGIPAMFIGVVALISALFVSAIVFGSRWLSNQKNENYLQRIQRIPLMVEVDLRLRAERLDGDVAHLERHFQIAYSSAQDSVQQALRTWFDILQKQEISADDMDQLQLLFKAVMYHRDNRLGAQYVRKSNKDFQRRRNTMHDLARLISLTIEKLLVQQRLQQLSVSSAPTLLDRQRSLSRLTAFLFQGRMANEFMDGMRALDDIYQFKIFYPEKYTATEPTNPQQRWDAWTNWTLRGLFVFLRRAFGMDGKARRLKWGKRELVVEGGVSRNLRVARERFERVFAISDVIEPGLFTEEFRNTFGERFSQSAPEFFEKNISAYHEQGNQPGGRIRRGFSRAWTLFSIAAFIIGMLYGQMTTGIFSWEVMVLSVPMMANVVTWVAHWLGNHAGLRSVYYDEINFRFNALEQVISQDLFKGVTAVNPLSLEIQETTTALKSPVIQLDITLIRSHELTDDSEWRSVQAFLRQRYGRLNLHVFENERETGDLSLVAQAKAERDQQDPDSPKLFLIVSHGSLEPAVVERVDLRETQDYNRLEFALGNTFRIANTLFAPHLNIVAAAGRDRAIPVGGFDRRGFLTVAGVSTSQREALSLGELGSGIIGMRNHTGIHPQAPVHAWHQNPRSPEELGKYLGEQTEWVDPENQHSRQLIAFAEVMVFSTDSDEEWAVYNSALEKIGKLIQIINEERQAQGRTPFPFDLEWELLVPLIREYQTLSGSSDKNPMGHLQARLKDFPAEVRDEIEMMFTTLFRKLFNRDEIFHGEGARELNQLKLTEDEIRTLAVHISVVHPLFSTQLKVASSVPGTNGHPHTFVPSGLSAGPSVSVASAPSFPASRPAAATVAAQPVTTLEIRAAVRNRLGTRTLPSVPAFISLDDAFFQQLPAHVDTATQTVYRVLPVDVWGNGANGLGWQRQYLTIYGTADEPVWNGTPTLADKAVLEALAIFKDQGGNNAFTGITKLADASIFVLTHEKPMQLPEPARQMIQAIRAGNSVTVQNQRGFWSLASGTPMASITELRAGRTIRLAPDFQPKRSEVRSASVFKGEAWKTAATVIMALEVLPLAFQAIAEAEGDLEKPITAIRKEVETKGERHPLVVTLAGKIAEIRGDQIVSPLTEDIFQHRVLSRAKVEVVKAAGMRANSEVRRISSTVSVQTIRAALEVLENILPSDLRSADMQAALQTLSSLARDNERSGRLLVDAAELSQKGFQISVKQLEQLAQVSRNAKPVATDQKLILDASILSNADLIRLANQLPSIVILFHPRDEKRLKQMQAKLSQIKSIQWAVTDQPLRWVQQAYRKESLAWDPEKLILVGSSRDQVRTISSEYIQHRWVLAASYLRGESSARYQALSLLIRNPELWRYNHSQIQDVSQLVSQYLENLFTAHQASSSAA